MKKPTHRGTVICQMPQLARGFTRIQKQVLPIPVPVQQLLLNVSSVPDIEHVHTSVTLQNTGQESKNDPHVMDESGRSPQVTQ